MNAAESLRVAGYNVEVEQKAPDLYRCHLIPLSGSGSRVIDYGPGSTEREAIERAWSRYQQER